ncbi:carboxylating nicotinate-nucleotide diphosphorylase [Flexibacterium corallicola]|uniref:carboxylating nicotinate-nucleotide diphosphorylase n=1 Tax=Flexibacterium corallicola TaxID=3037259 RepID=UPI00286F5A04|nr:carboxylating nicotinate-nucleotide diphosphorylase [Pseudovibrio sp. M1P-2-3]
MTSPLPTLSPLMVDEAVKAALLEDLGRAGDITSQATIPADAQANAVIVSRQNGVLSGLDLAISAFAQCSTDFELEILEEDGSTLVPGSIVMQIKGPAQALLSAERVALNYLGHLSGIASATKKFADEIAHTNCKVVCTRKTTPGLRAFEKYAVRCGNGANHRFGLDDAILIKDNHIAVAGGIKLAIERARSFAGHLVRVEVEVDTLDQMKDALEVSPDVIMLDNIGPEMLAQAVELNKGRAILEASGGVNLSTVKAIAESGVDLVSTGWITHSAPVLDLGLDISID